MCYLLGCGKGRLGTDRALLRLRRRLLLLMPSASPSPSTTPSLRRLLRLLLCLRQRLLRGLSRLLRFSSSGDNHTNNRLCLPRRRLRDRLDWLGWRLALCLRWQGGLTSLAMFAMTLPATPASPAAAALPAIAGRGLLSGRRLAIHLAHRRRARDLLTRGAAQGCGVTGRCQWSRLDLRQLCRLRAGNFLRGFNRLTARQFSSLRRFLGDLGRLFVLAGELADADSLRRLLGSRSELHVPTDRASPAVSAVDLQLVAVHG